jgi:NAD(P)-dependent dehydrogenase (short-subunit alcohol dehydrogenase family)
MTRRTQHTDLAGTTALVTGAARGIGAATARALHDRGVNLVLVDVDGPALQRVAATLPDRVVTVVADVLDLPALEDAVTRGVARFGGLDHVIANAGIASYGSALAVDPEVFRRVIEVNVVGVFHTVRAALPALRRSQGYVLVVSSLAAFVPAPGLAAYNTSKAGVEQLANALRLEETGSGVAVGCAHMSWIDTPMVREARADLTEPEGEGPPVPGAAGRTEAVEVCAEAFIRALERRSRRVHVPRWVGLARRARNVLSSPLGDLVYRRRTPELLARIDRQVARLGRSTSAHTLDVHAGEVSHPASRTATRTGTHTNAQTGTHPGTHPGAHAGRA